MMPINKLIVQSKDYAYSDLNDIELVMINVNTGKYVSLNETGKLLWQLTEQPVTFDNIVTEFLKRYQISEEDCRKDLEPFIEKLLDKKIIVNAD
jgi:DNA-directed RNA polymerase delta subunit